MVQTHNFRLSIVILTNSFCYIQCRTWESPTPICPCNCTTSESTTALFEPQAARTLTFQSQRFEEDVVIGYGVQDDEVSSALRGRVEGISVRGISTKAEAPGSIAVPFKQSRNQTTVDFEITAPYSVKSDNKSYSVDMATYRVPAFYQYYAVPKVSSDAFLIAHITGWEQYNLLEGEANLFFEDTFTGKTLIDARYASDTLRFHRGRIKT